MTDTTREAPASLEKRAAALEIVLRRKVDMPESFVTEFTEHADDAWITANGAQMVVTFTSITTCRTTCPSSTSGRASPKITDIAGIKRGYYAIHDVNPTGIVPLGPGDLHLTGPHDRGRLGAAA